MTSPLSPYNTSDRVVRDVHARGTDTRYGLEVAPRDRVLHLTKRGQSAMAMVHLSPLRSSIALVTCLTILACDTDVVCRVWHASAC